jgi:hypothetical protein
LLGRDLKFEKSKYFTMQKASTLFIIINLFLINTVFSQSKKTQIETLHFQADSLREIILIERETSRNKEKELDQLNSELKNEIIEIQKDLKQQQIQLKETIQLNEELHKRITGLEESIKIYEDSMKVLNESSERSINNKSKWILLTNSNSLTGIWSDQCKFLGAETPKIEILSTIICIGPECEYGGTIEKIEYDLFSGIYRITFINDNDMAGDGEIGTFQFYHNGSFISFLNGQDELTIFEKCRR